MKFKITLLISIFLFAICFHSANAMTAPVSLDTRTNESTYIAIGELHEKIYFISDEDDQIYTLNIIDVTAYLKGHNNSKRIGVITRGGVVGDRAQVVFPSVNLQDHNEYMFFIKDAADLNIDLNYESNNPSVLQAELYAGVQGVMTKQRGFYHDLHSEPVQNEAQLCSKINKLTHLEMQSPDGTPFAARYGDTKKLFKTPVNRSFPITSIAPSTTVAGTIEASDFITISGSGFGATPQDIFYSNADDGGASIISNGVASDIISWNDNEIVAKVPSGAGTGPITVNGQVSPTDLVIRWSQSPVYSSFLGFPEVTRQRQTLVDKNGNGGYTFTLNSAFDSNAPANASFTRALETWVSETGVNIDISNATTGTTATGNDGTNVVYFTSSLPNGTLGRATINYSGSGGGSCTQEETVWYTDDMDIEFRTASNWNFGPAATTGQDIDFESVALHEIGHAIGLSHVTDNNNIMHYIIANATDKRSLNMDDIDAMENRLAYSEEELCLTPAGVNGPHQPLATVPVEFISFHATKNSHSVILDWSTASEMNNEYFTVERSRDGIRFSEIGRILGQGNSSTIAA